jgi:predicted CXXCH cytochrome family protein
MIHAVMVYKNGRSGAFIGGLCCLIAVVAVGLAGCEGPGYVGTDTCLACHNGKEAADMREYLESAHAFFDKGCEECHGPGALHVRNGGRYGLFIKVPDQDLCARCHAAEVSGFKDSLHFKQQEMDCFDCHDPHSKLETLRPFTDNQLCLQCHAYQGFATEADIEAHTFHSYDPTGTGASRCVLCHMVPGQRVDQDAGLHFHTMNPVPPVESNLAGTSPAPPNSCSGITGCHDGTVITAPVYNVDNPADNNQLQIIFEARYGS